MEFSDFHPFLSPLNDALYADTVCKLLHQTCGTHYLIGYCIALVIKVFVCLHTVLLPFYFTG
jgi:hypothetical protein